MVVMQEIDTSNGVIFPFYDQDTSVIYLCGKVSLCICVLFCVCLLLCNVIMHNVECFISLDVYVLYDSRNMFHAS